MYKLFNRWSFEGITIDDPGLGKYIDLSPIIVPRSGGRHANTQFHKSDVSIVERLMNKMLVSGHNRKKHKRTSGHMTGKKSKAMNLVKETFKIIEEKTGDNPIKVLVKAIENSAPREEIITIEYGGARYPQSVECSPQRRVDLTLRWMTQGSYAKSFKTKKPYENCLAEEIMNASREDKSSKAISNKFNLERQSDSAR